MRTIITILFAMICLQMSAQKPATEFLISGGGGVPIVMSKGASVTGFGANAGLGFMAFFSQQIGFHLGAEFGMNKINLKVDSLKTLTSGLIDANNYVFDLHTKLSDYNEIKQTTFLSIPIMLLFQSNPTTHSFYAMGGVKILFQHQTNYESSVAMLSNAAYYSEFDNWAATQKFANLGTFKGNTTTGNFNLNLFTKLAFETGMKWKIGNNAFLYTGAFLDYNLNDPARHQRQPLENYILPEQLSNFKLLTFSDRINLMTAGIKLRLAFSRSSTPKPQKRRGSSINVPCYTDRQRPHARPVTVFNHPNGR